MRNRNQTPRRAIVDSEGDGVDVSGLDDEWDSDGIGELNHESDADDSEEALNKFAASNVERWRLSKIGRANSRGFKRNDIEFKGGKKKNTVSERALNDLEDVAWESEGEGQKLRDSRASIYNYRSSTDDENYEQLQSHEGSNANRGTEATLDDNPMAEDLFSESEIAKWESDATSGEDDYHHRSHGEGSK